MENPRVSIFGWEASKESLKENPKVGSRKKTLKLGIPPIDAPEYKTLLNSLRSTPNLLYIKDEYFQRCRTHADCFKYSADRLASSSNHNAAGIAAQTESRGVAEGVGGKRRRIGGPETSSWVQTTRTSPDYKTLLNSLRSTPKPPYIEDFERCRTHADFVKFFADRLASSSNHNAAGMAAQTESSGVVEGGGGKRGRIGGPETSSWVRTTRTSLSTKQQNLNAQSTMVASSVEKTDQGSIARGISLLSYQNDSVSNTNDNNSESKKNRCESCNREVGVLGFECHCGGAFCGKQTYPEAHSCNLDLNKAGRPSLQG
ncbi:PREDICTED: uncharacterized protein LOC103331789 [Prunus mume]|uniref:Uncharacterized protein LOC103331789 n=1 Tax=Prunus mume TaxID=102107 RepID=A0ABM0P0K5_PRUMU|nr:PREDICTED: uncharacterized protein LOC103331789 [Prunus mume]